MKKIFAALLAMAMLLCAAGAMAETQTIGENCDDECAGHVITGSDPVSVTGGTHHITLRDVTIDVSGEEACAFKLEGNAVVYLTLEGENVLKSGSGCAGLQVPEDAELTITAASTGKLEATGGSGAAGIGGGRDGIGGTITIEGGTIIAQGGAGTAGGAGIGGGGYGSGGTITISGGDVTAKGGYSAAGIGGGREGSGDKITISGGRVNATGDSSGAGIGGGAGIVGDGNKGSGGTITIEGGEVVATGGSNDAAGIGGGREGSRFFSDVNGNTEISISGTAHVQAKRGKENSTLAPFNGTLKVDGEPDSNNQFANKNEHITKGHREKLAQGMACVLCNAPGWTNLPGGADAGDLPQTGDPSMLGAWAMLLGAAGMGLKLRKKN